jgi:hypothetical protein
MSRIAVDGVEQASSNHATGNDFSGSVGTMLVKQFSRGRHRFTPRYRTLSVLGTPHLLPVPVYLIPPWLDVDGSLPHHNMASRAIDMGPLASILLELTPTAASRAVVSSEFTVIPGMLDRMQRINLFLPIWPRYEQYHHSAINKSSWPLLHDERQHLRYSYHFCMHSFLFYFAPRSNFRVHF